MQAAPEKPEQDVLAEERTVWARERTLLANERTFSAWIRTGLAAIVAGLGIAHLVESPRLPWVAGAIGAIFVIAGAAT